VKQKPLVESQAFRFWWNTTHVKWIVAASSIQWFFRKWRATVSFLSFLALWFCFGSAFWAFVLTLFIVALLYGRDGSSSTRSKGWWSSETLVPALIAARILPNDDQVKYELVSRPEHTDYGTSLAIALPGGKTLGDVQAARESLCSALQIPIVSLEITQERNDPANVVRFHVANAASAKVIRAEVADPAYVADWKRPVRIARDNRGVRVTLDTFETNTLMAGKPGSGKTSLARIPLSHYLLDVRTLIFLLDGKGSSKDYGACKSFCARFVDGTSETAVEDLLSMLQEVLDLVRARNANSHVNSDPAGVLVLLEEYQDVRSSANKQQLDRLDTLMGRIIRMGRAANVHCLFSTQRPSADDLPTSARNLITQRVALALPDPADAKLVLAKTPRLALPRERGEAIYNDGASMRGIVLDRLTDADWDKVMYRVREARKPAEELPELEATTTIPEATVPLDTDRRIMAEVVRILDHGDPRGMIATVILLELPSWAQAVLPSERALGVLLARHPELVERAHIGKLRGWRLPRV
jgi:hypothetical protein